MTTTKNSTSIKRMVIAALMLALAYILPNFTGNIPQIGNMLLPMHLPTILCGYLCGGIPRIAERIKGAIKPTAAPQGPPHK